MIHQLALVFPATQRARRSLASRRFDDDLRYALRYSAWAVVGFSMNAIANIKYIFHFSIYLTLLLFWKIRKCIELRQSNNAIQALCLQEHP